MIPNIHVCLAHVVFVYLQLAALCSFPDSYVVTRNLVQNFNGSAYFLKYLDAMFTKTIISKTTVLESIIGKQS